MSTKRKVLFWMVAGVPVVAWAVVQGTLKAISDAVRGVGDTEPQSKQLFGDEPIARIPWQDIDPTLPVRHGRCNCTCHVWPGVKHFVACCHPEPNLCEFGCGPMTRMIDGSYECISDHK